MPTYSYKCQCQKVKEVIHRMTETPDVKCECGGDIAKRGSMKILYFIVAVVVWCVFCALQEHVFKIEGFPWIMAYGYLSGIIANDLGHLVSE